MYVLSCSSRSRYGLITPARSPARRTLAGGFNAVARRRLGCDAELIVDEFGEKILEELDYTQEAKNIEEFERNFRWAARGCGVRRCDMRCGCGGTCWNGVTEAQRSCGGQPGEA